nr:E3 ubiquitin-protein ligase TRIM39-like [Labrus bergylta]
MSDQYLCPICKTIFNTRPELQVNTFISEMVGQFRDKAQQEASSSSSEIQESKPGEVLCDVCTGTKLKALKSCLDCLVSYCETHLEPHLTAPRLKRHQLIDPVENLEDRMCTKHDKPLELFLDLSKDDADREMAEGVQVFTALKESVERGQAELIDTIVKKLKTTEKQAEAFIKELEQEICELMKRSTEVQQLSRSEDHLHLIQRVQSVNSAPPTKDWTEVNVCQPLYEGTVRKAVAQLEETLSEEMKKLVQAELKSYIQQYAVDVTLDPDTAHPNLVLSEDGKQVHDGDVRKNLPDNPERFSSCTCVLGKQSFSSGRFYYEVQVKGKTKWDLGVAREFSKRKG